jgi:hypothetical protein
MGRGRAKAKQQKVARELKYNSHFTDLDALQRELHGTGGHADGRGDERPEEGDEDSTAYADHVDDEGDNWARASG